MYILFTPPYSSNKNIDSIKKRMEKTVDNPKWKIEKFESFNVIQDSYLIAGTKQRVSTLYVKELLKKNKNINTLCYTGTFNGYGALACAYGAIRNGLKSIVFLSRIGTGMDKPESINTIKKSRQFKTLIALDSTIYLCDDWKEARQMTYKIASNDDWTVKNGFAILPMGLGEPITVNLLAKQFKKAIPTNIKNSLKRLWLVAGSGTIAEALHLTFPKTDLYLYLTGGGKYVKKVREWVKNQKNVYIVNDYKLPNHNHKPKNLIYNSIIGYDYSILPYVIEYGKNDGCDFIYNVAGISFHQ